MAAKPGNIFNRQSASPPLIARNVNQMMGPLEGLVRSGIGKGLSQSTLYGGSPLTRVSTDLFAYARIGPDGIDGRDESDPDLIVPGKGFITVYSRTEAGLVSRGVLEPCENVFSDVATANWFPVIVVKIDAETWTIAVPDCVNAPAP